jgi:exodeoxyribonuclease X
MIIVLDTETTGLAPPEAEVIELAAVRLCRDEFLAGGDSRLIPPTRDIPPETSAVHHLTAEDFDGTESTLDETWEVLVEDWIRREPVEAFAAHNAEYDKQFLKHLTGDIPWLCTYRCARHLYPESPGFGNQVLRYYLGLKPSFPFHLAPHRALYDTIVTAEILQHMLKIKPLDELLKLQTESVLLPKLTFGEFRGQEWSTLPASYLAWIMKGDFDQDIKFTAGYWTEHHQPMLIETMAVGKHKDKSFRDIPKDYLEWILRQDFDVDIRYTAKHWIGEKR